MPGLGYPLGFTLGGSPSAQEAVYDAHYQAVGDGLQASVGSIVEAWRFARMRGIAASLQDDRAAMQAFPQVATDYLPVYEEILQITPTDGQSEQDRRELVVSKYTRAIDATYAKLEAQLDTLDPLFTILEVPFAYARVTNQGVRAFEDWNPASPKASGPDFNLQGRNSTIVPNVSSHLTFYAFLDVGAGVFTPTQQRTLVEAGDELNESLPAWVDFRLFSSVGFILDLDLLDVTAFGDGIYP